MTDHPEPETASRVLAFLDLATFENGDAIRGGCLITDGLARPIEFRVSGAIRPTGLQKVLYGDTLHEYICTELIGVPMLQALEAKPDLVLVRDAEFLKIRPKVEAPILLVRSTVEGQFVLQAFPGYEKEAEAGSEILPRRLRGRNVLEPFVRVRSALDEAHQLKVGEPREQ
jgi:hypothetical protein